MESYPPTRVASRFVGSETTFYISQDDVRAKIKQETFSASRSGDLMMKELQQQHQQHQHPQRSTWQSVCLVATCTAAMMLNVRGFLGVAYMMAVMKIGELGRVAHCRYIFFVLFLRTDCEQHRCVDRSAHHR